MKRIFNMSKTYAFMFVIGTIWLITINPRIVVQGWIMVTYWIFVNLHQVGGGTLKRIGWNIFFVFTAAAILHLIDMSIPGLVIKIITKVPTFGKIVNLVAIVIKMPKAFLWSIISVMFGWLAGILELEELPAFEKNIIIRLVELKYR